MGRKNGLQATVSLLEFKDYERIHEASLKILRETGIVFQCDEAVELFKKHGATVDGQRVYIPKELVDNAIANLKRTYVIEARNSENNVEIGKEFAVQPNAGAVYVQDLDNGRRLATIEDYGNLMRLAQASKVINLVGAHPLNPSDVPDEFKHLYMCYEIIKNSDKPVLGWCMSGKHANEYLDLLEISMGFAPGESAGVQYSNVSVNPLSPLSWAKETCETMMAYGNRGQGLYLLPCIMAGLTGPMKPFGMMVLQNTEILSGIVFSYLLNPATPIVSSPSSSVGYMKRASYITGTPEMMMINGPLLQMAHDYYHMPTRCMCGMTDAKIPDAQAGLETMQNVMMGIFSGADIINECLGVLDAIMTTSYEKHIIDEEIIERCLYIKEGVDTSDEALSVDVIQEVGPGGSYLTHVNTFENFKDTFSNSISECENYNDWHADGAFDVVERANKRYKEILAAAPDTMLDAEIDKEVRKYMDKVMA